MNDMLDDFKLRVIEKFIEDIANSYPQTVLNYKRELSVELLDQLDSASLDELDNYLTKEEAIQSELVSSYQYDSDSIIK